VRVEGWLGIVGYLVRNVAELQFWDDLLIVVGIGVIELEGL
jgi:hypothetical protein